MSRQTLVQIKASDALEFMVRVASDVYLLDCHCRLGQRRYFVSSL